MRLQNSRCRRGCWRIICPSPRSSTRLETRFRNDGRGIRVFRPKLVETHARSEYLFSERDDDEGIHVETSARYCAALAKVGER